jgi:dTDP-glucose 4,6-dehydratase
MKLPEPDLDHVLANTHDLWEDLRGRRIFITGGTGFFGCWLLESFARANDRLGLGASAVVLTRDPEGFRRKSPHLADNPGIRLHTGDVKTFSFPEGEFSHIIHAATESSTIRQDRERQAMFDTIVLGTKRVLELARERGTGTFMLVSSGAVYGVQPPQLTHVSEDFTGAPDTLLPGSAYGEGKRAAELMCTLTGRGSSPEVKIARGFAFVGPGLPLDAHFAIGNFIGDVLAGCPIFVSGDGTPYRSYLYAADLAIWLWTILLRGRPGRAYNVGSEQEISIGALARLVAETLKPGTEIQLGAIPVPGKQAERYVPSARRSREELGLQQVIDLPEAIRRTAVWNEDRERR